MAFSVGRKSVGRSGLIPVTRTTGAQQDRDEEERKEAAHGRLASVRCRDSHLGGVLNSLRDGGVMLKPNFIIVAESLAYRMLVNSHRLSRCF